MWSRLVFLVLGLALALVLPSTRFSAANEASRDLLNGTDRLLIARTLAEGQMSAQFIIACDPSTTTKVVSKLQLVGASVEKVFPKIGYVRAEIAIDRLDMILRDPNIQLMNYLADNQFDYDLQGMSSNAQLGGRSSMPPSALPTPSRTTPAVNPFTGLRAMGVPQFLKQHPTYDGRGVVVGLVEGADPLAPGLAKARALDGHTIAKFVAYRVAEGPFDRSLYGGYHNVHLGWVDMRSIVHVRNGRFVSGGISYRAPYDGLFRFGAFIVGSPGVHFKNTRRPGSTRRVVPATTFPVLWDESRGKVWINAHQDGNFTRERAIGDFHGPRDIGTLPLTFLDWAKYARPPTGGAAANETHIIVETDPTDHFIRFEYAGLSGHASMVTGSATGNGFFGGAFNGVAPGAQVSVVEGGYPFLIEALAALAESKVDVISVSEGLTPYRSADGVLNCIIDRIIRTYNVPIAFAAGNDGPTTQSVEMPSTASAVISVGGYISAETARYDEGAVFPDPHGMLAMYSSRGPANDGALKPDLVAQTEWLTSSTPEAPPASFRQTHYLPRGYEVGGGTSQATPTAAGTIALLISAAKQTGLSYTAELLKRALTSSGQSLPYQRFEIGGGLIDVPAAWSALQRLTAHPPPSIEASAPVRTVTSAELTHPNTGRGLYEREGWYAGMMGTQAITYTLASDARQDAYTYAVRIIGDTATFTTPNVITLTRGVSVALPVRIAPRASGMHSAVVELVDQRSHAVVDQRLCTVVAAERFSAAGDYTIVHAGSVEHPGVRRYFFAVPRGATALSVSAVVTRQGQASTFDPFSANDFIAVRMPDGVAPPITARYPPVNEGLHWAQAFDNPMPGVWEIDVQNVEPSEFSALPERAAPVPPTQYQLRAAVYKITAQAPRQSHSGLRIAFVNYMAPVRLESADVELAQVKRITMRIAPNRERSAVAFEVPAQTSQVFVRFARRFTSADIRLYLFNCAQNVAAKREVYFYQGMCVLASSANAQSGDGIATTANPRSLPSALYPSHILPAGRWVAVVDGAYLSGPVRVALEIGTIRSSSLKEISLNIHKFHADERWTQTFPLPSSTDFRHSTVALLRLHAANVVTIWQQNNADLIPTMVTSKPKILHRFGSVWSAIVTLKHQ